MLPCAAENIPVAPEPVNAGGGNSRLVGRDAARFDWPQAAERILPRQRDDALRLIGAFFVACRPEHGMQYLSVSICVFEVNVFQVAFHQ